MAETDTIERLEEIIREEVQKGLTPESLVTAIGEYAKAQAEAHPQYGGLRGLDLSGGARALDHPWTLDEWTSRTKGMRYGWDVVVSTVPEGRTKELHTEFLRAQDALYTEWTLVRQLATWRNHPVLQDPKGLKGYEWYMATREALLATKAINPVSDPDWFPASFSTQVIEPVFTARRLPGIVTNIVIPRSPFLWPLGFLARDKARSAGRNYGDTPTLTKPNMIPTGKVQFTTDLMQTRIPVPWEVEANSVVEVMPEFAVRVQDALTFGLEAMIANGDASDSAHMDSAITENDCAERHRDGLRKAAAVLGTESYGLLDSGKFTPASLTKALLLLDDGYLQDPEEIVHILAPRTMIALRAATEWADFQRAYATTAQLAALVQGLVPSFYGEMLLRSAEMPTTMSAGSAEAGHSRNTGSGSNTCSITFNKRDFWLARQNGVSLDVIRDPEATQFRIVLNCPVDFRKVRATDKTVAVCENVPQTLSL